MRYDDMSIVDSIIKTSPQNTIKGLIQILHDGQEGYRKASENVKDLELKATFNRFSLQRSKFAGELQSELLSLGETDPQKEGTTLTGAIHRTWIDLKTALTAHDDHAILTEAERGEDAAVSAFHHALEENLPESLHLIVTRQAADVEAAHSEIKALRDAAQATK